MSAPTEDGEVVELEEDRSDVENTDDGGAIVKVEEQNAQVDETRDFYRNIADEIDSQTLDSLASQLLEKIRNDKEAREKRDKQYEEGLRRTGLGDDAPGGATFQGASRVVHPMLTESCVDFSSRAIRELWPPEGPAKSHIPGTATKARVEKSKRKAKYLNWQCTVQMPELRNEIEQLLTQTPLAGVAYLRIVPDDRKKRPVSSFVPVDDVYLPYAASSFETAERITYVEHITQQEYDHRVRAGIYRDIDLLASSMPPEQTKAERANEKIEGKSPPAYNEDGVRQMCEVSLSAELEDEHGFAPYRVSIDSARSKVAAVVRNWEQDDATMQPMQWMAEWPFVPWRGAYPIGLTHMIGSLSGAATGALRALLDSAHINNLPTLLKLKGSNFSGQSLELNVTQVTEVEGAIATDDIRKLMMPVPFNPPSATLFSLLGFLVDAGKGVVQTTFEKISDQSSGNMPVGTTLALIEQGMKVFSSIHARLHNAMARTLSILHRIDRMYLTDEDVRDETGELLVKRSDFEGPLDVVPVSDPQIFSDIQRFTQMQVVSDRAKGNPLYDARAVELMILQQTRIPDAERLLVPAPKPEDMNAVNENLALTLQRPVAAFPDQDHLAHLQVHLDFLSSPVLGQLPVIAPTFIPGVLNHVKEHVALWYVSYVYHLVSGEMGQDLGEVMKVRDPETRAELDRTLAAASHAAIEAAKSALNSLPAVIQRAQALLQQIAPPPPDPLAAVEMAKIQTQSQTAREKLTARSQEVAQTLAATAQETEKKRQFDMAKDQQRQQANAQHDQVTQQGLAMREAHAEQSENVRKAAELEARERMNTADNVTALTIVEAETLSNNKSAVETGTGLNPTP